MSTKASGLTKKLVLEPGLPRRRCSGGAERGSNVTADYAHAHPPHRLVGRRDQYYFAVESGVTASAGGFVDSRF
jgi:hypothetical protein